MAESIRAAASADDYAAFGALLAEYVAWCRARYAARASVMERVFGAQSLGDEVSALAAAYGPPHGRTLLMMRDGQVCGAGAWRRLDDAHCELKRLFVPPRFAGAGLGRRLCDALIESARAEGYAAMRLDTMRLMHEAIAMYRSIGFVDCAPYRAYPAELLPELVFMERALATPSSAAG